MPARDGDVVAETLELEDIQGFFARGYGTLTAARYVLLQVNDPAAARAWLAAIADQVTAAAERPGTRALNLALTASGMVKLGLAKETVSEFADEFVTGMTTPHRQRILGDTGLSAPEHWAWGGPATPSVDLLLLLFAVDRQELAALDTSVSERFATGGLTVISRLETSDLDGVEHFGFRDGISQPPVEGLGRAEGKDAIRAGEFVLGYPNEYGRYAHRPTLPASADPARRLPRSPEASDRADLGKNGSYLVFRQLSQDVASFWRFIDSAVREADGSASPAARRHLAAKMVGRWPSGAPLTLTPDVDDATLSDANDFTYHYADPHGYGCPVGAHIRRANPRDSLDPNPGSDQSIAVNKRHRLLRRGREYGPPLLLDDDVNPLEPSAVGTERGLHFICLNASIVRQFEFVQSTWLNNPKFDGLYEDADPVAGSHRHGGATFTIQGKPVRRRLRDLPEFVTVRGGAYFFLPGISAIRYIASLDA
jgi:Dyp-type peroxidase family